MATRAELVAELLNFPRPDRAEAARELLESLDGSDDPAEVEAAWTAEIQRRIAEVNNGTVELLDGPTAMQEIRDRLRERRERSGE